MTAYKFGPFLLSKNSAVLKRDGVEVALTRRRYEIIRLLVERAGQTVARDEIVEAIWKDQVVDESNVAQQIYAIRRLLGDTAQGYIETIPGVGYRFGEVVEEVEFQTDEDAVAEPDPPSPLLEVAPPGGRRWVGWLIAGAFGLLALGAGLWWGTVWKGRETRTGGDSEGAWSGNPPVLNPLISLPGIETNPVFSPDGRYLSFAWVGESANNYDIYYVDLTGGERLEPRQLTTNLNHENLTAWSPDSREIAFLRMPEVAEERYHLVVAALNGPDDPGRSGEREVGRVWGGLDWSPDGRYFAVSDNDQSGEATGIYLLGTDGRTRRALSNPPRAEKIYDTFPRFSPDGSEVAFVRWLSDHHADLFVVGVGTGQLRQLTSDGQGISALQWSADGRELIFTARWEGNQRLWRIAAGGGARRPVAGAPYDVQTFDISPRDGRLAYTDLLDDVDIHLLPLSQAATTATTGEGCSLKSSKTDFNPVFSPDNRYIAFESTRSGGTEIWLAGPDCSNPVRLTYFNEAGVGSVRWAPDGRRLVFNRYRDGRPQIHTINIDGSGLRQLTDFPASDFAPTWSPDGQTIYFATDRFGQVEIARVSASGGSVERVTTGGGRTPAVSDDGRYLYYTRNELLRRLDLPAGRDEPLAEMAAIKLGRYWCLNGDYIYYAPIKGDQQAVIYRFNLGTRRTEKLFEADGILPVHVPGVSVSRDHRRIAFSSISYRRGNIMIFDGFK